MPPQKLSVTFDFDEHQDELIEVVDDFDEPVLVVSAFEARRQKLRRRVILVLLHDTSGKLYLQRRGKQKTTYPGLWDVSASGHVRAGEAREDAARRELYEELGVKASGMAYLTAYATSPEHGNTFVTLFHATAPAAREQQAHGINREQLHHIKARRRAEIERQRWLRVVDTSRESPDDLREEGHEEPIPAGPRLPVPPRTVLLLRSR